MTNHDYLAKSLLTTFFADFLDLFLPELSARLDRDSLEFLDKEVFTDITAEQKHEADLIVRARWKESLPDQPREAFFLVHVEHQSSAQSGFNKRMFRYFARLHEKFDLPIFPIALFSFDTPRRAEPESYEVGFPMLRVLDFRYHVIQLNRMNWRDFVRHSNPVASALMSQMQIEPSERAHVKLQCLRLLTTLKLDPARMQLISGYVDTYLKLSEAETEEFETELEKEAPAQKEEVMQIVTSWMQEGIEIGQEAGQRKEALKLAQRLLRRRLSTLPRDAGERIKTLPLEKLEDLSEALLDFKTRDDLQAWLDQNI